MKLPKWLAKKIDNYETEQWCQHVERCAVFDVDPHDIDPYEDWLDRLLLCFDDVQDGSRYVLWGELKDFLWSPTRKKLKLCKVGWHSYSMGVRGPKRSVYQCSDCRKATERVPRWAR